MSCSNIGRAWSNSPAFSCWTAASRSFSTVISATDNFLHHTGVLGNCLSPHQTIRGFDVPCESHGIGQWGLQHFLAQLIAKLGKSGQITRPLDGKLDELLFVARG